MSFCPSWSPPSCGLHYRFVNRSSITRADSPSHTNPTPEPDTEPEPRFANPLTNSILLDFTLHPFPFGEARGTRRRYPRHRMNTFLCVFFPMVALERYTMCSRLCLCLCFLSFLLFFYFCSSIQRGKRDVKGKCQRRVRRIQRGKRDMKGKCQRRGEGWAG